MNGYNLKIPLAIVKNYSLSSLAILVYGEIYGICSKKPVCYITDKTLMKRHHSNKTSIQNAISELKKASLIKRLPSYRKEERKLKLLPISETGKTINRFILIPDYLLNDTSLKRTDELIYGYLISESKKREKINRDKRLDDSVPFVITTKKDLAKIFNNSPITIKRSMERLKEARYLSYESINGKYLEIEILSHDEIFSRKLLLPDHQLLHFAPPTDRNLYQNRVSTCIKNGYRPVSKSGIDLYQNRVTNRILNRVINKEDKSSSNKALLRTEPNRMPLYENELAIEPIYYDKPPSINDMPPKTRKESSKDIQELNEISIQHSASKYYKDQNKKDSAKSGLGVVKDKAKSSKLNQDQNKKDSAKSIQQESSKTIIKTESKYEPYNGFNLDYQCKELQNILRRKTGKRYTITNQRSLIEQRLQDGFTLYDFESAIICLFNKGQSFSIKELVKNISNYKNKINSN